MLTRQVEKVSILFFLKYDEMTLFVFFYLLAATRSNRKRKGNNLYILDRIIADGYERGIRMLLCCILLLLCLIN
jgi:hypothetical protein